MPGQVLALSKTEKVVNEFFETKSSVATGIVSKKTALKEKILSSPKPREAYKSNIALVNALFATHEKRLIIMQILKMRITKENTRQTLQELEKRL